MPLIDPRPQTIPVQIPATPWHPEPQQYAVTVFPDLAAAPNEGAKLTTWLALTVIQQSNVINALAQQCAALAVAVSQSAKCNATAGAVQPTPASGSAAPHDAEQHALALAAVHEIATRCKLSQPSTPSDDGEQAPPTGSALDNVRLPH